MEEKTTIGNVCFLFDKNHEKVLLLHRSREPMKGFSTGVGGKTEFLEDIHSSCKREVFEETGFHANNVKLKGVLKTILHNSSSSWILFVYTGEASREQVFDTEEGKLEWVIIQDLSKMKLIGFIQKIMSYILDKSSLFEGTMVHDSEGNVLQDIVKVYKT